MKISSIFAILTASAILAACDFLDEYNPNSVTVGNYYTSEEDIVASLNGVYTSLTQSYVANNNHYFTDVRANATVVTSSGNNSGIPYQFYNYTLTEENVYVYNRYSQLYKIISRANTLFAHLGDVSYATPSARDTYEAEARFLRALSYYWLVTEWGDVPLVLKVLESAEEVRGNNYRRPKAEIYQAIFDDLKYVTESPLADVQPASACGKVSKAAAWALWGKALLQQACDEDFVSSKSELLGQAIEKLTAAWNLRKFGELTSIPYSAIWDLSTQKSCAENIFQINYIQGNADLGSVWNYLYGPEGTGVTSQKKGEMQNVTTQAVYDSFETGDVRRSFLRATNMAGQTYYHTMKYADLECGANGYGGNNWIVLRYADVALMLAEAYYWSKEETLAKTWLNKVRERAGLGDWSGSDLRQGIYDERLHEFMQEGLRWQDLLRMYDRMEMLEHFSAINSNFSSKDLLLPIPYNERILNPEGLYQNPGYGDN